MATHSSILAWRIPRNRGAWRATANGVTKPRMGQLSTVLLRYHSHLLGKTKTKQPGKKPYKINNEVWEVIKPSRWMFWRSVRESFSMVDRFCFLCRHSSALWWTVVVCHCRPICRPKSILISPTKYDIQLLPTVFSYAFSPAVGLLLWVSISQTSQDREVWGMALSMENFWVRLRKGSRCGVPPL